MNRKFIVSVVALFVVGMGLGFFNHGVLLYNEYMRLPNIMRLPSEAQAKMPLMVLAYLCISVAFTWLYLKTRDPRPWLAQGVRFGLAISVLTAVPTYLIYHVVSQFPLRLAVKQIVLDSIMLIVMGVVVALINRKRVKIPETRGEKPDGA